MPAADRDALLAAGLRRRVLLQGGDGTPVPVSALLDGRSVVLLGDPGLGKSVCMEAVASAAGVRPRTMRGFLAAVPVTAEGPLVLDGLDETMALSAELTVLDDVVRALAGNGWPTFWLSCRPADWARADGRALLAECAPGGFAVAHLLPLSREEIEAVIAATGLQPREVVAAMAGVGLLPLLGNPQTLGLTAEVYAEGGPPSSRTDLYRRATEHLAREHNRHHAVAADRPAERELLDTAGAVSAVLLLSGRPAVEPRGCGAAGDAIPLEILEPLAPADRHDAALRSRLFAASTEGGWAPLHRTIAEFLAADWLARRGAPRGEPLGRTLALVCGGDGPPEPSLGVLFAWLAALLPDRAEEFVGREPYAVAAYGDVAALRPGARRALLEGLRRLSETEPFFRAGRWGEARLGALAVPELAAQLRQVLAERPVRLHLLSCALDAIEHGEALPELAPDLVALLLDPGVDPGARESAVGALAHAAPPGELHALFGRLLADDTADPRGHLAGRLLLRRYPDVLGDADVEAFLARFVATDAGHGDRLHLEHELPRLVPAGGEAALLDRLARRAWMAPQDGPFGRAEALRRVARRLAARAIPGAPPERVVAWLPLLASGTPGDAGAPELRPAFGSRPDLYVPLLAAARRHDPGDLPLAPASMPWWTRHMLPWLEPPADAADRAVAAVEADPAAEAAVDLYASSLVLVRDGFGGPAAFGRCHAAARLRPEFEQERETLMACRLAAEGWRREHRRRDAREASRRAEAKARDVAYLTERLAGIEDGTETRALAWLASGWFGIGCPPGEDPAPADPAERLARLVPAEIVEAAKAGFRALAERGALPTPGELAAMAAEDRFPAAHLAAVAGADLLFAERGALAESLPPERRTALLCLGLVHQTQTTVDGITHGDRRPWMATVADALPVESARAVRELLLPQIAAGTESIGGLHELCGDTALQRLRQAVLPDLLAAVPAPGPAFDTVRRAAFAECPLGTLAPVVAARLAAAASPMERWPWLVLAWRVAPADHEVELVGAARRDRGALDRLVEEVGTDFDGGAGPPLAVRHREALVRLTGPLFPPAPIPEGSWSAPTPYDRARFVHRQIAVLGDTGGAEAGAALEALLAEAPLADHADHLRQAVAAWRRRERLAARTVPPLTALVRALSGGPPATRPELHAFVIHHLRDLDAALRSVEDDAWRAFWNVEAQRGPTGARPEEDCRDAVKRALDARFERAGLAQDTEARKVGRTRCDIVVDARDAAVPVEVKCDWNRELWTAWGDQLDAQYCRDPRSGGYGVYLVLWFGDRRGGSNRVRPPPGARAPTSAAECQRILDGMMVPFADRLAAVVMDVTPVRF